MNRFLGFGFSMLFFAAASGCSGVDGEASGGSDGGSAPAPAATSEELGEGDTLIARVDLSDTHRVRFFEDATGNFGVDETYHLDLDKGQPTLREFVSAPGRGGLRLAQVYRHLLAERADASLMTRFEKADSLTAAREAADAAREAADAARDGVDAARDETEPGAAAVLRTAVRPMLGEQSPGLSAEVVTQAACTNPPGFSWSVDGAFQARIFCGTSSDHCRFNMATDFDDFRRTTGTYIAVGVAQDFCNVQHLTINRVADQVCPPFARTLTRPIDQAIQPRTAFTHTRTVHQSGICYDRVYFESEFDKLSGPNGSRGGLVVNPSPAPSQPPANCDGICQIGISN